MAEQRKQTLLLAGTGHKVILLMILHRRYEKALGLAVKTHAAAAVGMQMHEKLSPLTSMDNDIETHLGPKPSKVWNKVEKEASFVGLLFIMFHLCTINLTEVDHAQILAQTVSNHCRKVGASASNQQLWVSLADTIDNTFVHPLSADELNDLGNTFAQAHEQCLQAANYLGSTMRHNCSLKNALDAHIAIFPLVFSFSKHQATLESYRRIILPFFVTYWGVSFKRKRAQFNSPRLVEAALAKAYTEPEEKRVQAILKAISFGLDNGTNSQKEL